MKVATSQDAARCVLLAEAIMEHWQTAPFNDVFEWLSTQQPGLTVAQACLALNLLRHQGFIKTDTVDGKLMVYYIELEGN